MYSDRRRNGQKPPRTKPSRQKTLWQNAPEKTPRTIEREFVQGAFVRVFCTRPTKNRGVRDVWRTLGGVPGCVTKCDRGGGQNWPTIAWRTLRTAHGLGWMVFWVETGKEVWERGGIRSERAVDRWQGRGLSEFRRMGWKRLCMH